jgi:hypothetical protein
VAVVLTLIKLSSFADVVGEIKEHRVNADHRIMSPELPEKNYITEFRWLVQRLYDNLNIFIDKIANSIQVVVVAGGRE